MCSSGGSVTSSLAAGEENCPLWSYVSIIDRGENPVGGGNKTWKCSYCHEEFNGSYTRVKAHLLKLANKGVRVCKVVSEESLRDMKKLEDEAVKRLESKKRKTLSLPSSSSNMPSAPISSSNTLKKRKGDSTIEKAYNLENRKKLDALIARLFYTSGLPFNMSKNPVYYEALLFAANNDLSGYIPPGYNKLRTTLLIQEKAHVEKLLQPVKSKWDEKGVTIVSDGWSDPQRRPIINFMVVSDGGPMFLKSVDCSGEVKDKNFIASKLEEVINEIGDNKVVQVITDNAPNCKAAGEIIEGKFPSIYWTPCVVHTLNLALKNICAPKNLDNNQVAYLECHWITEAHDEVLFIKNFVMNHQMRLSIFNRFSPLKLLAVADTRFASAVVMLKRFALIRSSLEKMVLSAEWNEYKEDDNLSAQTIRDWILSTRWWEKINYIIAFTNPIYSMIRECDTDKPSLHLVYEKWDSMIENVKKAIYEHDELLVDDESSFFDVINDILMARWAKSNTPLHCLAHSLNPRYYTAKWLQEKPGRVAPHKDNEVYHERSKCFKRIFQGEDLKSANNEYAIFIRMGGDFHDSDAIEGRDYMEPQDWWAVHGSSTPLLQTLAMKVLGQPSSSSCCERNWSTYSFIHSLKRNKLAPKRAEHLVFIHNNLRLLSRANPEYHEEKTKMWDVGGDEFGSMEDIGILETSNLTLDEPALEFELCEDADDDE